VVTRARIPLSERPGLGLVALLVTPLIFGVSFPALKVGNAGMGVLPYLFVVRLVGACALAAIVLALPSMRRKLSRSLLRPALVLGSLLSVALSVESFGLAHTTATNAAFLNGLYVVLTPLLALIVYRTLPSQRLLVALGISLAGIALLSLHGTAFSTGDLIVFSSTFIWSAHILAIERYAAVYEPLLLALGQTAVGAVLQLAIALPGGLHLGGAPHVSFEIFWNGVLGSGVAFTAQMIGQRHIAASAAALVLASEIVVASIVAAAWLGERLGPRGYAGAALVCGAIVLAQLPTRQLEPPV
jgi:drug/metabolite transporter (DMT)-like permease